MSISLAKKKSLKKVPTDFNEHECTIMLWPYREDLWRQNAEPVQEFVVSMSDIISSYEDMYIGVHPGLMEKVRRKVSGTVRLLEIEYDDIWIRDTFPTIMKNGAYKVSVDWSFNAWGGYSKGLCPSWEKDDSLGFFISEYFDLIHIESNLTIEGGALLFDDKSRLYTTKSCLLNNNRNPGITIEEMEKELLGLLPLQQIVWFDRGLEFDETDGHIDNLCATTPDNGMLLTWTDDPRNPQYNVCREALIHLNRVNKETNIQKKIHKIPIPIVQKRSEYECDNMNIGANTVQRYGGEVLLGSYINFVYLNGAILLPTFQCELDELVLAEFRDIFPDREIICINARELILGGGGLHCATAHIPK